jgi:phosphatidylglycerophosphate synthase
VSLWRVHLGRKGLAVPARASAKAKTFAQAIAVGCALAPALSGALWVADVILWVSVALTVASAVQYAADGHRAATSMNRDRDRP